MPALAEMFGESPRAKLIEGLLRLGSDTFTRGELARESGVFRTSANRVIAQFEIDGLVEQATSGKHPLYRATTGSAELELLAYLASVLEYMQSNRKNRDAALAALAVAKSEVLRTVHALPGIATSAINTPLIRPVQGETLVIQGKALSALVGRQSLT